MSFPTTVFLSEEQITQTFDTQQLPLGTRGCATDGRVFRYAQAGATALMPYRLCISMRERAFSTSTLQAFYSPYAVGTTMVKIYLDVASATADYFKDGYLAVFTTDTQWNQIVPIDSNETLATATAALGTAGAKNTVWLKPPGLKKIADTDSGHPKLVPNPYKWVLVSTDANGPGYPLGITPAGVTAKYYFWLQTWGPTLAHAGEGIGASIDKLTNTPLYWSTGSTGGVCGFSTGGTATGQAAPFDTDSGFSHLMGKVGTLVTAAPAANYFHMINLTLAP